MNRISLILLGLILFLSCAGYIEKSIESPLIEDNSVIFCVRSKSAKVVQVAGDWNNWARGDATEGEVLVGLMARNDSALYWERTVELESGRYKYRFLFNESVWMLDPNNPRIIDDGKGGKANLLIVP
jgi:hypothetical protein